MSFEWPIEETVEMPRRESALRRGLDALASVAPGPASPASRYLRCGVIKRGGMGSILKVWDRSLGRFLAMKYALDGFGAPEEEVRSRPQLVSRLVREARFMAHLEHPGVLPVYDIGLDRDERFYFTMKLVVGCELEEIVPCARDERDGWSVARAARVIREACETVAFAHGKGIVHRDLKPSNVLVGSRGHVYVVDWGLATTTDPALLRELAEPGPSPGAGGETAGRGPATLTRDGAILGTPSFMSPEQAEGRNADIGPRSDVYSAGALLYTLLAGHPPYLTPGRRIAWSEAIAAVRRGPPAPLPARDPLALVCARAMSRTPEDRYPDMNSMAAAIGAAVDRPAAQRRPIVTGTTSEIRPEPSTTWK